MSNTYVLMREDKEYGSKPYAVFDNKAEAFAALNACLASNDETGFDLFSVKPHVSIGPAEEIVSPLRSCAEKYLSAKLASLAYRVDFINDVLAKAIDNFTKHKHYVNVDTKTGGPCQ